MKEYKNIVVIPARGGSKRLPNKNIKLLGELPLVVHSIKYALVNGIYDIFVSTDDDEIKKIAKKYNVKVIDRPSELATDNSPTIDTVKHALESLENKDFNVILLQPTNPLRPKDLLKNALKIFEEKNFDSLMSVTRNHQKFGKIINQKFIPFNYEIGQRSQDLEPLYYENGLLYITKSELILKGQIIGNNNFPMIVNHPFSQVDIDTKEDFEYAEYMLKNFSNE